MIAWHGYPSVWIGVVLLVGGYLAAAGPLRGRFPNSKPLPRYQIACFLTGVILILLALISPLDDLGDHFLLTAHMLQHLLLGLIAPPLLLLGIPAWLFQPWLHSRLVRSLGKTLTQPLLAFGLFNLTFMIWHAPVLYEAALNNETIHLIEHLTFMLTGLLSWWPILSPFEGWPPLPAPAQVLYLFLQGVPMSILGALIVFAPDVLYSTYELAPRILNISALVDQQIAGLLMWMLGGAIYLVALGIVFFQWMAREERSA